MEEKYYLYDVLASEKAFTVNMATALNEASCDHIYKTYLDMFKTSSEQSKELFNLAYNKNWYELTDAQPSDINAQYNKLNDELNSCL